MVKRIKTLLKPSPDVRQITAGGHRHTYVVLNDFRVPEQLPTELFGNDLQKVNTDNQNACLRFAKKWGAPCLGPSLALARLHAAGRALDTQIGSAEIERAIEKGFKAVIDPNTSIVWTAFANSELARAAIDDDPFLAQTTDGLVVDMMELQVSLRMLQSTFAILIADGALENDVAFAAYLLERTSACELTAVEECLSMATPFLLEGDHRLFIGADDLRNALDMSETAIKTLATFRNNGKEPSDSQMEEARELKLAELSSARKALVERAEHLMAFILGEGPFGATRTCAEELFGPLSESELEALKEPGLAQALCLQFKETAELPMPWSTCPNPTCGRFFKRYREYKPGGAKRFRRSVYCSSSCRSNALRSQKKVSQP